MQAPHRSTAGQQISPDSHGPSQPGKHSKGGGRGFLAGHLESKSTKQCIHVKELRAKFFSSRSGYTEPEAKLGLGQGWK